MESSNNKTFNNQGNDFLELTSDRLSIDEISDSVKAPECGAISLFIGTTRNNFNDLKVVSLHYEAYKSMALKVLKDICNGLREKWPDIVNIAMYHRLGDVPVCEASVVIAISSPHRQTSLSSVECAINKLKELAPIWKKEEYENVGMEAQWKENVESCPDIEETIFTPDPNIIQINSSHDEVFSNIETFLAYRKSLNNQDNIRTYCNRNPKFSTESSCSRIDAVGRRQIDIQTEEQYMKEHFDETNKDLGTLSLKPEKRKKRKNSNSNSKLMQSHYQPKIQGEASEKCFLEESNNQVNTEQHPHIPFGVRERLVMVEHHLGIRSNPELDMFARMKLLEDRIIEIENNCEKYFIEKNYFRKEFNQTATPCRSSSEHISKGSKVKVFSIEDIEKKIEEFKQMLTKANDETSSNEDS